MVGKISRCIGFLCFILVLSGCATASKSGVSREALSQIKVNVSTKDQVRQLLGEPVEVRTSKFDDGKTYEYWGYSKGAASMMILFGTSGKFEGPVIVFRPDGVVDYVGISRARY